MSAHVLGFEWRLPYQRGPDNRLYPMVRIGVEFPGRRLMIAAAVIDTGAPLSVFDGRVALDAGIDADALRQSQHGVLPVSGFIGNAGRAYVHHLTVSIGDARTHRSLRVPVAFTDPDDRKVAFNVLGRRGFLDRLLLGVDDGGYLSPDREPALYVRIW